MHRLKLISKTFEDAVKNLPRMSAAEKGRLVQNLYRAYVFAETEKQNPDHIDASRIQDALLTVVRSLDHTQDFKTRIDNVACTMGSNAGNSMDEVLSQIINWDKLDKKEKRAFAQSVIETMKTVLRDEFEFDAKFDVSTKFVRIKPYDIPHAYPSTKTHMGAIDIYRGRWEVRVNEEAGSSYDNGLALMQDIFESGVKIAQNQLGYMKYAMGFNQKDGIPAAIYPDAENVSATYVFGLVSCDETKQKVDEVLFTNVYAKARSEAFSEDLRKQIEDRKPALARPEKQNALQFIVQAFGLK